MNFHYSVGSPPLGLYLILFRVLFTHVACLSMCVLFYLSFVCLFVYESDFKSIAGVPLRRDSADHPITAHQCVPDVMGGLAVWQYNKTKLKNQSQVRPRWV